MSLACFLLSVKAGRQMGAVRRRLDGGGRAGTGVEKKKSSPHERMSRPASMQARRVREGEGGGDASVMDVPCEWSPRHAHMETTPRPGQRSRQSSREAGGLG